MKTLADSSKLSRVDLHNSIPTAGPVINNPDNVLSRYHTEVVLVSA